MKKVIFLISVFVPTAICSCKKDVPEPQSKPIHSGILKPIMDPPGHHYTSTLYPSAIQKPNSLTRE